MQILLEIAIAIAMFQKLYQMLKFEASSLSFAELYSKHLNNHSKWSGGPTNQTKKGCDLQQALSSCYYRRLQLQINIS